MIRKFFKEYRTFYALNLSVITTGFFILYLYKLDKVFLLFYLASCLLVGVFFSSAAYISFYRKMKLLEESIHESDLHLLSSPLDESYLKLLRKQSQNHQTSLSQLKAREENLDAVIKMLSHQMKVPISSLSLMSQTDSLNQNDVNLELLRLDLYLTNLLNYLKITSKSSDFRFEEIEVKKLMVDTIKKYKSYALKKNISVEIEGSYKIKSDKKWLNYALSQIIDNSMKYVRKNGKIKIFLQDAIIVEDDGIGILKEDLPRIFDEGFTGFNGREHQKATGFGLYLTKKILDQLEMDIKIESTIDIGSKVTIKKK